MAIFEILLTNFLQMAIFQGAQPLWVGRRAISSFGGIWQEDQKFALNSVSLHTLYYIFTKALLQGVLLLLPIAGQGC